VDVAADATAIAVVLPLLWMLQLKLQLLLLGNPCCGSCSLCYDCCCQAPIAADAATVLQLLLGASAVEAAVVAAGHPLLWMLQLMLQLGLLGTTGCGCCSWCRPLLWMVQLMLQLWLLGATCCGYGSWC